MYELQSGSITTDELYNYEPEVWQPQQAEYVDSTEQLNWSNSWLDDELERLRGGNTVQ